MPRPPRSFCINAKNYFLTYPHCNVTKEAALEKLKSLQTPTNILYIRVCRELHSDGEPHLHALIQFEGRYKCQNIRFFDIQNDNACTTFHPNIQSAKSCGEVQKYIAKDGDFIEWGTFQNDGRNNKRGLEKINDTFSEALNSNSKDEALQILKEGAPRDFWIYYP